MNETHNLILKMARFGITGLRSKGAQANRRAHDLCLAFLGGTPPTVCKPAVLRRLAMSEAAQARCPCKSVKMQGIMRGLCGCAHLLTSAMLSYASGIFNRLSVWRELGLLLNLFLISRALAKLLF